ncbi:hypothetical protein MHM89_17110 [Pseudoalteromonas sp. CNC9-20]|uniref:hypothetical protein n=1 Tax=Pseudoalteromonas sp. CNC9-20 TaxID=2917750 RepID=UPI001EF4938B|nr:hypothetical protein [Pseudoalteromonas sp. CNC9-20]MCG7571620.1 hypothetical protein [Pseudoalteromonas sp. CNC9-20]
MEAGDENFDWETFDEEMEADLREIEVLEQQIEEGFEWVDVFVDLEEKLNKFNSNMESIYQGIVSLNDKNKPSGAFLNGMLLVGIVSAYESFVHDLFDGCCRKKSYISRAVSNVDKLTEKDRVHLRLKKNNTEEYLAKCLKKATLHDPVQIARISLALFDLKMPILRFDHTEKLLEERNVFTHHGGYLNGQPIDMKLGYVLNVYKVIYQLINGYIDAIKGHVDLCLGELT